MHSADFTNPIFISFLSLYFDSQQWNYDVGWSSSEIILFFSISRYKFLFAIDDDIVSVYPISEIKCKVETRKISVCINIFYCSWLFFIASHLHLLLTNSLFGCCCCCVAHLLWLDWRLFHFTLNKFLFKCERGLLTLKYCSRLRDTSLNVLEYPCKKL